MSSFKKNTQIKTKKTKNQTRSKTSSQIIQDKVTPVAVIGVGCLFPGSNDKEGYWQDITTGRDMVTEVPPSHFLIDHYFDPDPLVPDKTYCRQGAFLDPIWLATFPFVLTGLFALWKERKTEKGFFLFSCEPLKLYPVS